MLQHQKFTNPCRPISKCTWDFINFISPLININPKKWLILMYLIIWWSKTNNIWKYNNFFESLMCYTWIKIWSTQSKDYVQNCLYIMGPALTSDNSLMVKRLLLRNNCSWHSSSLSLETRSTKPIFSSCTCSERPLASRLRCFFKFFFAHFLALLVLC
jgi:hypothetical protein